MSTASAAPLFVEHLAVSKVVMDRRTLHHTIEAFAGTVFPLPGYLCPPRE
jgi:hypothetical protein